MDLTREEVLIMLKKSYMRGVYEHMEQRYRNIDNEVNLYPVLNIPNHIVEDLLPEEL